MKYLFRKFADNQNKNSVSYKLRQERFGNFVQVLDLKKSDNILDVGGTGVTWIGSGFEKNVTLLNLTFDNENKSFNCVLGDACNMIMFPDKSFDVIYSNSVIEHVGKERQNEFAKEINRVGKKYWVQTPYRHFPIESHLVFPLFQYFPEGIQKLIALRWPYSHYRMGNTKKEVIIDEISKTYLLNKEELLDLFADAEIFEEKFFGFTKSIVALRK